MRAHSFICNLADGTPDLTIAAVLELGCLFGALGAGVLADKVSRRSSIASACGAYGSTMTDVMRE